MCVFTNKLVEQMTNKQIKMGGGIPLNNGGNQIKTTGIFFPEEIKNILLIIFSWPGCDLKNESWSIWKHISINKIIRVHEIFKRRDCRVRWEDGPHLSPWGVLT